MNCFRYAITVAWNHKEIGKYPEIITKIKAFIKKYEKKRKKYPSEKDHCKNFEKNNLTIALNVLFGEKKKKHILPMFQNITQIMKNKLFI